MQVYSILFYINYRMHINLLIKTPSAVIQIINLLLHRAICDILLPFNVLRLTNNVIIQWCWLFLLLLLASSCQRVELLAITLLPHSTVVYYSTNQCCNNE